VAAGLATAAVDEIVARYYDLEHDALVADAALYRELARDPAGSVLELGCGTGRIVLALSRAGHRVVGLDLSPPMLARAEAKLRDRADLRADGRTGGWTAVSRSRGRCSSPRCDGRRKSRGRATRSQTEDGDLEQLHPREAAYQEPVNAARRAPYQNRS